MIRNVAVLGAGTMGAQIAGHAANAGLLVLLLDVTVEQAKAGLNALQKSSPSGLFVPEKIQQIEIGSFDKDLERIRQADWVIEAIVENPDIKKQLLAKVDSARRPGSLITTNTSGLSVTPLAKDRTDDFRRHWFGTHFFNPPRYMKLLEIIPTAETDPAVLAEFEKFADIMLGKGIVHAKDTPNFIANRIGLFAALKAIQLMQQGKFTIEEVDRLTGTLIGHPKTATFRTIDMVGVDIFVHVADNIYENALFQSHDRAATFVSELLTSVSDYAASRIPEISDDPDAVDRAMRWGFAWEMGPFELAKTINGELVASPSFLKKHRVIRENPGASLRDLGDGVACLEFHSKMNTIGNDIISLLFTSLDEVNANFEGLVIGNEGQNFSAGADFMLFMMG